MPCAAATLGSWWSILPLAGPFYLLLRRAALEDAFLHQHLEGYRDYAARVRWRLLPGVW
jgi:protein-S-isoprenylcysteine O-methyltransferase Ste14